MYGRSGQTMIIHDLIQVRQEELNNELEAQWLGQVNGFPTSLYWDMQNHAAKQIDRQLYAETLDIFCTVHVRDVVLLLDFNTITSNV